MKSILILDDDLELCELLTAFLSAEGFSAKAYNDSQLLIHEVITGNHDLLILDVMLPGMNGFEVLKEIRQTSSIPVLMLTARGEDIDKIVGLELGADDYLPKPFNPRELVARIRAISRRLLNSSVRSDTGNATSSEVIHAGDISLEPSSRRVTKGSKELNLTAVEFKLLEVLMKSAGQVVKRQDLAMQVLERTLSYDDRSLDVHISNLRRKIGNQSTNRIQTIRSVGYIFTTPPLENTA